MSWITDAVDKYKEEAQNPEKLLNPKNLATAFSPGSQAALQNIADKSGVAGSINKLGKNKAVQDFAHKLGFGKSDAEKEAEKNLAAQKGIYAGLQPPDLTPIDASLAQVTDQGPSAYNDIVVNPAYKEAQLDQLGALKNLAAKGGHDAASDYNLAQIQQNENANEKGQRDAILQNANARGMGGSGAALLAQLNSAQNATNRQSLQDMDVLGQRQNTAIQAGQGAAGIASNLQNSDYNQAAQKAAANDAIAKFNAGQKTGMSQYNAGAQNQTDTYNSGLRQTAYQNEYQKAAGQAGANMAGLNYNQAQSALGSTQAGNILGAVVKGGTAIASSGAEGSTATAHGGKIPGMPMVHGDSYANDTVPIMASPGEIVIPRSLAKQGSPAQITDFVKNPPQVVIKGSDRDKEMMLSALRQIRNRRG